MSVITWNYKSAPSNMYWSSVAFGNGIFVATAGLGPGFAPGSGPRIITSTDGNNWTLRDISYNNTYVAKVTFGNGIFLATTVNVGASIDNTYLTSTDGINWTTRPNPNGILVYDTVKFVNNIFFLLVPGLITMSSDGINWTTKSLTTGGLSQRYWSSIAYGNGRYVITCIDSGANSAIITSTDAINWSLGTLPNTNGYNSITYGKGLFVAVGNYNNNPDPLNRIITSTDGITWSKITDSNVADFKSITYSAEKDLFVIGTQAGTGSIFTSSNGITWTKQTLTPNQSFVYVYSLAYGNGTFVGIGNNNGNGQIVYGTSSGVTPTLGELTLPTKTYGDNPFTITDPSSNSTGTFAYISSNTSVATISGNTVTIVGVGTTTITAIQGTTTTYNSAQTSALLTVNKADPTYGVFSIPAKAYGDSSFNIVDPSSNSNGAFTYTSSDTTVATISGKTITIVGAIGATIITATQAATTNYNSSETTAIFQVNKANPTYGPFSFTRQVYGDPPFTITDPSSNSSGTFTYTSSDTNVATISGNTVTIVGLGTTIITATQAESTYYNSSQITATLHVGTKPDPTFGTFFIPTKTYGDAPFTITDPSSNSTGSFTYTSSDTSVADISGNTVTIIGTGTTTITAIQDETIDYYSSQITTSFTVNKANPTFGTFSVPTKTYGDASFNVTDPSSNSNGTFTYTSSDTSVATIFGNTVTIVGPGTTTVTATQSATANYNSSQITASFIVNKITPTLGSFSLTTKTYGDTAFTITDPSSNSSGAFTYTSSDTTVATISGKTVTIVGAGTTTITATQAATATYSSITTTASLTVNKKTPTLGSFSVATKTYGDSSFNITDPSSNSNGAFTYTSSDTTVATISGKTVTIVGAGTTTITATQAATTNYESSQTTATFQVNKITPTYGSFLLVTKTYLDPSFNVTDPSSNSNGTFTYTSSNTSVATISGNTVTIVGAGTTTITATQAATTNYNSSQTTTTFQVNKATPTYYSFSVPTKTYLDPSFVIVDPSSNSNGAFTYTSSDTTVATISGNRLNIVGAGTTTITATQAATTNYESSQTTTTFQVNKATPTFGSFLIANKIYGAVPFNITNPSSNSNGAFTYTSSDTNVATISGNTVTIVSTGTTTITATQAETTNYISSQTTASLTVNKSTPIIGTFSLTAKTYLDPSFDITNPSSISDGTFTYTSSNTGVATISGNTVTIVAAGTTTITATQASTTNYNSATKTATLTVNKANPTYGAFSVPTKTFGDDPFNVPYPTSNSSGTFYYTLSPLGMGFFSGNMFYISKAGTVTITANQLSTADFNSSSTTASLTVNKANPTFGPFSLPIKTYEDGPFSITDPTSNSDGTFSYTSSNTGVATISGKTITIVGAGTTTITATQAATSNYNSLQTTATFQVNKATPIFGRFFIEDKFFDNGNFTITPPTTTSNGAFVYTSSDTQVVDISGNIAVLTGIGSCTITATQQETANYLSKQTSSTFDLYPTNNPIVNVFTILDKNYGDSPFSITPPNSDYISTYTYTSSNTNIASISGNTVTIIGAGTCTITARKSGIFPINTTFTVNKISPTFGNLNNIIKNTNETTFQINGPSSNSNGDFVFTSLSESIATISGNTVTVIKNGTSVIKITQLESNNYLSRTIFTNLYVSKQSPAIGDLNIPSQTYYGDIYYITDLSSNSNGLFNLNSSDDNVAITYSNVVNFIGVGNTTITVTQYETNNYSQGQISKQIQCSKATPIYGEYLIPSKTYSSDPFYLQEPSSSSNGTFTYTSSDTSVVDICGNYVTIVGIGSATITASQSETEYFLTGSVSATITVGKETPIFGTFTIPPKTASDPPFTIIPPTSNSNGAFTFQSNDTNVATISNDIMTIVSGDKLVKITATQLETTSYASKSVEFFMFIPN